MNGIAQTLTAWDWVIGLVLLASLIFGLWRGFISTVAALAAWIAGIVGAPMVGHLIASLGTQSPTLASIPSWVIDIIAFLLIFIVVRVLGGLLLRGARRVGLGGVDRVAGGALGIARAGLIVLVMAVVAHRLGMSGEAAWQHARAKPLLDEMVRASEPFLPPAQASRVARPPQRGTTPNRT